MLCNLLPVSLCLFQKCFDLKFESMNSEQDVMFKEFPLLFSHLGSTIVDIFFVADKDGINWFHFLKGYTKCCARTVASVLLNNLLRVFSTTCCKAGLPVGLKFEMYDDDCKMKGSLSARDIFMLLWICWIFSCDSRTLRLKMQKSGGECIVPDISHLVFSAIESCAEDVHKLDFWDSAVSNLDIQLHAEKIHMWALKTVPNLAECLQQFVHARLCYFTTHEVVKFFHYFDKFF